MESFLMLFLGAMTFFDHTHVKIESSMNFKGASWEELPSTKGTEKRNNKMGSLFFSVVILFSTLQVVQPTAHINS